MFFSLAFGMIVAVFVSFFYTQIDKIAKIKFQKLYPKEQIYFAGTREFFPMLFFYFVLAFFFIFTFVPSIFIKNVPQPIFILNFTPCLFLCLIAHLTLVCLIAYGIGTTFVLSNRQILIFNIHFIFDIFFQKEHFHYANIKSVKYEGYGADTLYIKFKNDKFPEKTLGGYKNLKEAENIIRSSIDLEEC